MVDDPALSPHQAIRGLLQDIFRKMIKDFPLKLKGITVVVNTVKSLQRRCDLSFFQISHRFLQCIKIVLHCLLRKDHIVIPVQTYQIILGFSEYTEKLFGNGIGFFPVTFFFRKAVEAPYLLCKDGSRFFCLFCFFQKECTVGAGLHTQIRIQGLNTLVQYPPEIHWRQSKAVNSQKKFQIKFMMESVYLFLINILVIVLGMIIIFHKGTTAEIIDHGRDPGNSHGKIIRPGFNGIQRGHALRINPLRHLHSIHEAAHKIRILIGTSYCISATVCMSRKLKIQICDHVPLPLRSRLKYLAVSTCGPVIFCVGNPPFFCCKSTYHNSMARFIATTEQRPGNSNDHGHCRIIVLKSLKIGIIVST